jgi:hypothetical protein
MPFVTGNKIAILNVYDACITLTDAPTHFSEYVVNGVTYTSVDTLQASLLDVIYTRLSLGTISGTGTVTNVSLSLGSTGTDVNGSVASPTTTPIITLNIPTASATNRGVLSTTDWTAFNTVKSGTAGTIPLFSASGLQNSLLSQTGNQINLGTYAAFGVNNPGTPGDPGVDNDAWIGSIINNDFLIKVNNIEAARFDTALRLKIANIPNATTDTDKFLVSDGGMVKYRTGAELLSDIGAYNATNPAGYISGITSGMVTTALGFTPYNATNPAGYTSNLGTVTSVSGTGTVSGLTLSGTVTSSGNLTLGGTLSLTSGQVTTALGFTPYNATNPAGYITSAALSGYLPLSGGTLESSGSSNTLNINHTSGSGIALNISKNGNGEALTIVKGSGSGNAASITGGITLLSELNLTTKLADAHINSAAVWNAKQNALNGTGFVKISGTTISYDNSSYALASAISGTTNYLAKFTASGVVGNSLIYDNGTNVGIGTTTPARKLEVSQTGDAFINIRGSFFNNSGIIFSDIDLNFDSCAIRNDRQNNALWFSTAGINTERMRITSGGNLLIGTTTDAGYKLDVNGTGRFSGVAGVQMSRLKLVESTYSTNFTVYTGVDNSNSIGIYNETSGVYNLKISSAGAATFSSSITSTGFFVSSDITLKTLTQDTFDASKIDAISYKWKTDLQGKTLVGYSAQEVQKYMPDAVNTDSNGKLSVDYIQVLVQKIAHLENKLKEHGLE